MNTATISTSVAKYDVNVQSNDRGFSPDAHRQMAMIESFSESLSISVLPPPPPSVAHRRSTTSICSYSVDLRFRESVTLEPTAAAAAPAAVSYADTLVVYPDDGTRSRIRTRFRTSATFRPKPLRPNRFVETTFVRPKRVETRYVSCVEYGGSGSGFGSGSGSGSGGRRWHTTSVTVRPAGSPAADAGSGFRSTGGIVSSGDGLSSSVGSSVFLADDDDDDCGTFPGHGDLELLDLNDDDRDAGSEGHRSQLVVVRGKVKDV